MSRALVLNATWEPLCVVTSRRALLLVLAEKAETVERTGRALHAAHVTVDEPSVVRLCRYVRLPPPRRRALNRRAVFVRDDHTCQYCGAPAESIDHVVPRSRGGQHSWDNVVAACLRCNRQKRDRLLHETSMRLPGPPRTPAMVARVVLADRRVPDTWAPYLTRTRTAPAAQPA
jgi:5-methylcytosine-specific restriction endonuclease McrA